MYIYTSRQQVMYVCIQTPFFPLHSTDLHDGLGQVHHRVARLLPKPLPFISYVMEGRNAMILPGQCSKRRVHGK